MPNVIRKATYEDSDQLLYHIVRAFDDDPAANYLIRQDAKRSNGFYLLFQICLCTFSLPHDEVYTTSDATGGALWVPPQAPPTPMRQLLALIPKMVRVTGLHGIKRLLAALELLDKAHPKEIHYYLQVLGVDPEVQGKGLGSALMGPVLARCNEEGWGAYLENSKQENTAFYERHGFTVREQIYLGPDGPPVWCMWRDPQ